jgi:hypothetical protein
MKHPLNISTTLKFPVIGLLALLTACNSSDGDSDNVSTATISGAIVAAPVSGAQVSVVDASGNVVVESVTTKANGQYSLSIPADSLGQDLIISSSGGSFTDEATGNVGTAGNMFAYLAAKSISDGSSISVTPDSTIVAILVLDHGKTMIEAKTIFAAAFGYTPDVSIQPMDATTTPAADVSDVAKLSGLRAASFSQLAMDLGLSQNDQFEMFAALAQDLSDGTLDGADASGAVNVGTTAVVLEADIQNRFIMAMETFHGGDRDMTGLTNDQIGNLPFAKTVLTSNYKIEYIPGMMTAMEGKTMFKLRITDKTTGAAVTGLSPTLMSMMHMAAHMHSSPDMDCAADAVDGDYNCTVYYLMPSAMADGTSMGYWTLMVMVGMDDSAIFFPEVMMAMGDTAKVTLKGGMTTDAIPGMTGVDMSRNYFVFKESLTGMGNSRTFTMFVAAMESMKSYPAVSVGTTLNTTTTYELITTPMTVEVSTDTTNWVAATDNGNGNWSASPVTGLIDDTTGTIYVRLIINGEQKTTDGMMPATDGTNDYGMFSVTPGGM